MRPRNCLTLISTVLFAACLFLSARVAAQQGPPPPGATPQPTASPAEDLWLTVRLAPGVSAETLELISRITEPRSRTVKPGESLQRILKGAYGDASEKFEARVRAFNPAAVLQRIKEGKGGQLALPAAPNYDLTVIRELSAASELPALARRETGAADSERLNAIKRYTSVLRKCVSEGRCRTPEEVRLAARNDLVALPFASRYVSFPLKQMGAAQLAEALGRLEKSAGVTEAEVHERLRLIPHLDLDSAAAIRADCIRDPLAPDWPVRHLSLDKVSPEELAAAPYEATTVAILDSGIAKDDTRFSLWKNAKEEDGLDAADEDGNEYSDDKVGYDFVNKRPFPEDDHVDRRSDFFNHGTHVAGLASGTFLEAAPPENVARVLAEASRRVRPMILKIAWDNGDVETGAVFEALDYAREKGAPIVNMSFSSISFNKALKNRLREYDAVLYVVAAGNGHWLRHGGIGQDLNKTDYFPAKFSPDLPNLISVAAHGELLERPCFSNYGSQTVDLAAPGVQVSSTVTGGYMKTNGTSQAAPLVTFTAALLHSTGLTGPARIKERLLASVDFVPALRDELVSGGVLNVAKALNFRDDLIELDEPGRPPLRGRLVAPPPQLTVAGRTINFADVRKIVTYSPEMGLTLHRVWVSSGGKLEHHDGTLDLPKLKFKEKGAERCTEIPFEKVRDLIPAALPPAEPVTCPE